MDTASALETGRSKAAALLRYLAGYVDPKNWLALLYLLARLPLAMAYAFLWGLGLAFSTGLAFALVGIFLLVLLLYVLWGCGRFERALATWWLEAQLRPQRAPVAARRSFWRRLRDFYTEPVLWKTMVWTLVQIPAGVLVFVVFGLLLVIALALITAPVVYLAQLLSGSQPLVPTITAGIVWPPLLILWTAAGAVMLPGILHLARVTATVERRLAQGLLSVSATRLQLAESRARAAAEQARAEQSERSRRELIVNVSHELRTPIASIQGHVEALLAAGERESPERVRGYLEVVQRETERLGALADDLLAAAQADAGELRLEVRPVQAGDCARQVAEAMRPLAARERSVTLVDQVAADLPLVMADHDRLVQVLANLVRNAIKYTPEGGIVALAARPTSDWVEVSVSDTGIGIPATDLDRIFDRFYRTDASRSRATGGFGLGLAISRDLVVAMGGSIVASSREGVGSTFTVCLRKAGP